MKIKQIIILLFLQLYQGQVFSQNLFEVELVYSPVMAKLISHSDFKFENKLFHSVGIEVKKKFQSNIYIDAGLYLRKLGARFELPSSASSPSPFKVSYSTTSIDIPVNIGYYFLEQKKIRMGIEIGLDNGFLLNQKSKSLGRTSEIGIYRKFFLGLTSGIEFGFKLKPNFILNIKPNLLQQINKNNSPYKQGAIGIAIGVIYIKK